MSAHTGGNAHFYFLSPLPSGTYSGVFNPDLYPVLEVCRVDAFGACDLLVARYTRTGTSVTEGIVMDPVAESYQVNWKLEGLTDGTSYLLRVLSSPSDRPGVRVFGTINVLATSGGSATITDPETGATRNANATLPVKFRIEKGALCTTLYDDSQTQPCLEVVVDYRGGTFANEDSTAGAYFPMYAIEESEGPVVLVIEEWETPDGSPCIPTTYPQYLDCFRFRTVPAVGQFGTAQDPVEVVIGICPEPSALPFEDQLEIWKVKEDENGDTIPGTVQRLPRRNVDFLSCPGIDYPVPTQLGFASRLLRPLAGLFLPATAYAGTVKALGGGLNDFSRAGWVRPLGLLIESGDGQTGIAGEVLALPPTVKVIATGELVAGLEPPVVASDIPVAFTVIEGDGSVTPVATSTNGFGLAATTWTLGATPGTNRLRAAASNPLIGWPNLAGEWGSVTFTANGIPWELQFSGTFLPPVGSGSTSAANFRGDLDARVEICYVTASGCSTVAVLTKPTVDFRKQTYSVTWSSSKTLPGGDYRFRIMLGQYELSSVPTVGVPWGTKATSTGVFAFELGRSIPIKFTMTKH